MAMRCFGRARGFAAGSPRALASRSFLRSLALICFRAVDLAAVLRAGDFFCAAVRAAARGVGFFVGSFLAIHLLPFHLAREGYHRSRWIGPTKRARAPRLGSKGAVSGTPPAR